MFLLLLRTPPHPMRQIARIPSTAVPVAFVPAPEYTVVSVSRTLLRFAVQRALVESCFADPPQPQYVGIKSTGDVFRSRVALHIGSNTFSILAVRCDGMAELLQQTKRSTEPWTREEYTRWLVARNNLDLVAVLRELRSQAHEKMMRIELYD